METYKYLLDLAIILLCTKALGLATRKVQMPQVVGALLAGVLLGPAMLGILTETSFIHNVAEIGVIVLMFCAGLETDIQELKASGKASFVIALIGVIVPLIGGYATAMFFNRPDVIASDASCSVFLQNIFIGVILTATSVSITVETLKELGKLKTKSGNAILGAAIIDDVLGIIALTLVTSMADESVKISVVLLKIVAFFAFAGVIGLIFYKIFKKWTDQAEKGLRRHAIMAFVFCLLMAYVAEKFFGVADITGAFVAGLAVSGLKKTEYVVNRFNTLSYMLLSPIFFANIGLAMTLDGLTGKLIIFMLLLMLLAVVTKVVGCGLGAKIMRYTNKESLQIGIGMISRGEVALIVANKGASVGLMSEKFMTPLVIMVVFTTIVTPILLKFVFPKKKNASGNSDSKNALETSGVNAQLEES